MRTLNSFFYAVFILLASCCFVTSNAQVSSVTLESLSYDDDGNAALLVKALDENGQFLNITQSVDLKVGGETNAHNFTNGKATVSGGDAQHIYLAVSGKTGELHRLRKGSDGNASFSNIPLWTSMIPPLIAIILALVFKEVLVSLFMGIWAGAFIINGFTFSGIFSSLYSVIDTYLINALADADHLSVVIFSLLIGAMVAIISRNGGMAGVVSSLSGLANSARNTQLVTWFLGIAIFFDDYANTLIVGNTMRPVTDSYRISREKLAYLVDSTAAPIAAIAFVTTWIGAELGYIQEAIETIQLDATPYALFLGSLKYSFYPVLTLLFALFLVLMNRDYGTMFKAESRARLTGDLYEKGTDRGEGAVDNSLEELEPVEGAPHRWINAVLPILVVVGGTLIGLWYTGSQSVATMTGQALTDYEASGFLGKLSTLVGKSNSYAALLWSSISAVIVALLLTIGQGIMSLKDSMETLTDGIKTMLPAILILVLAWALGQITKDLQTAAFLTDVLQGFLSPYMLPMLTFILGGAIAFATGSSWSTMAILYPLMLPTTWSVSMAAGLDPSAAMPIFLNVISAVLAGSVFGDHCSPISDTTILSSLASSCNHIDHVRTQLPYALSVGIVSIFMAWFSTAVGLPAIINFAMGIAIIFCIVRFVGKKVPDAPE